MTSHSKPANEFLQKMTNDRPAAALPDPASVPEQVKKSAATRAGLKHIGGYFDLETVERVAILRARLRLDNSELIKLAVDELYRKNMAKRAFGDA